MNRQFDHIGIFTDEPQEGESWVEASQIWVTNPRLHPQRIEYLRPKEKPQIDPADVGLWKLWNLPHVAYRVDDLERAVEMWIAIEKAGLVNHDFRETSWADSIRRVIEGNALFVLFDGTALKPLTPAERESLGFLPFPGSQTIGSPWKVGSLLYLVAPSRAEDPEWSSTGGKELLDYFTSEGVVQRVRGQTGLEVYAGSDIGIETRLIPSITSDARNPDYRQLIEDLLAG